MNEKKFPVQKSDEEWRRILTPAQYAVLRGHGTELSCTSPLDPEERTGAYFCVACNTKLFESPAKFHSGTGWPSFWAPIEGATETSTDRSHGMVRTEAHCANCGGHLGHVFTDGPKPTGERYCINGVALKFEPS
jgi:peptide-methionine (R)-S-oxide reductase